MVVTFEAGTVVAQRYRIVRVLGKGGSAMTYEAVSIADGHHVALKHIALRSLDDPKDAKRAFETALRLQKDDELSQKALEGL